MKKIAFEEHFSTEEHLNYFRLILQKQYPVPEINEIEKYLYLDTKWLKNSQYPIPGTERLERNVLDLDDERLKAMDEAGIDMQVLSLVSPGVQVLDNSTALSMAQKTNDILSKLIRKHPARFAGLAAIPTQDPNEAANELKRAVKELGLKGACINSHTRGEYLDEKKYRVIFSTAEELEVPIYIHPRIPSPDMLKPLLDHPYLTGATHGYGAEVDLHARRLIFSGIFNKFPNLKIILGHLGEGIPYWLWRLDNRWSKLPSDKKVPKKPSEYFKDNFLVTTSGMFSQPALLCAYLQLGADNILFAVDYPFESNEDGVKFMDAAPLCDRDKEKIYHINAEMLLKL